jgi:hypothetical protein
VVSDAGRVLVEQLYLDGVDELETVGGTPTGGLPRHPVPGGASLSGSQRHLVPHQIGGRLRRRTVSGAAA